jgi:hypothetical protein
LSFRNIIIIIFIHMLIQVNESIPESSFKTTLIIIFILTLIQVNDQLDPWSKSGSGSTPESGFKTMILTLFYPYVEPGQPLIKF